jgi:hypothetical protein
MTIRRILVAAAATAMCAGAAFGQDQKKAPTREKPAPSTPAQPEKPAQPAGGPDEAAMQAAWMAAMTPGKEHERLNGMIGEWDATAKFWMDPAAPPVEGTGTAKMEWVLGGRHVRQDFNGTFMEMPFQGVGHTGYDNVKKKYVGTWMDTMSTSIMYEEGEYDAASGMTVMHSTYMDPMGREIKSRNTVKIEGPDKMVFTMYSTEPGKPEVKSGEITYTRKGGAPKPATPATPATPARPAGGGGGGH